MSHPLLSGSQLLYSFLTPDTEKKTAFTLDAVANKAGGVAYKGSASNKGRTYAPNVLGTMLKSVKLKLKKEVRESTASRDVTLLSLRFE